MLSRREYVRTVVHMLGAWCVMALAGGCAQQSGASADRVPADSTSTPARSRAEQTRTTSSQTSSTDDTNQGRYANVEQLIEGRFTGVQVIHLSGGGYSLRIRGPASFYGSAEPLFVLDGTPLSPTPNGTLSGIDPRDIERIEVLKDAAATSAYGIRGSNGVILIKTKRARKP